MAPTLVVVDVEIREELPQVVQATDERDPRQPFPLECPDETFRHRDGTVLADRPSGRTRAVRSES